MYKAKLNEICQRLSFSAKFSTSLVGPFTSEVTIIDENGTEKGIYKSYESQPSKKKAENCAAEIALNSLLESIDNDSLDEVIIRTILKFTKFGLFDNWTPVEALLLCQPVRSAIHRINDTYRRDPIGAVRCLYTCVDSHLNYLQHISIETIANRKYIMNNCTKNDSSLYDKYAVTIPADFPLYWEYLDNSMSISSSHMETSSICVVVIPANPMKAPYEVVEPISSLSMAHVLESISRHIDTSLGMSFTTGLYMPVPENGKKDLCKPRFVLSVAANLEHPPSNLSQENNSMTLTNTVSDVSNSVEIASGETSETLNLIASWLVAYPVKGDVIFTMLSPEGYRQVDLSMLQSLILSSLPSGILSEGKGIGSNGILDRKSCMVVLREIMSRRGIPRGFILSTCTVEADSQLERVLHEEPTPIGGWWSSSVHSLNLNEISNSSAVRPSTTKRVLRITLPDMPGLFSCSGMQFQCSTAGSEAEIELEQVAALEALYAIERTGEGMIRATAAAAMLDQQETLESMTGVRRLNWARKLIKPDLFVPSIAVQRRRLILAFLHASGSESWMDIGCNNCSLLTACLKGDLGGFRSSIQNDSLLSKDYNSNVKEESPRAIELPLLLRVCGVDTNETRLQEATKVLHRLFSREVCNEGKPEQTIHERGQSSACTSLQSIELWHGSFLSLAAKETFGYDALCDRPTMRWQAVTCIEVIEHLSSEAAAEEMLRVVLLDIRPDFALFSTPNYEANTVIRNAVLPLESCDLPHDFQGFREEDHKFEFTRQQFRDWAYLGIQQAGRGLYEVEFVELGSSLPGMADSEGVEPPIRGCGGATQVAIFRRIRARHDDSATALGPPLSLSLPSLQSGSTSLETMNRIWQWRSTS